MTHPVLKTALLASLLLARVALAAPLAPTSSNFIGSNSISSAISTAAMDTQKQCQMQLHHDADEYVACIDRLLAAHSQRDATRLGIEYFGWVGALNSARISLPGASFAADRYLRIFRKTQRQLKVDDLTLCQTVPGNCTERLARMRQLEAQPPMKTDPSLAEQAAPHKH